MDESADEEFLYWPAVPPWRYKLAFSRHPVQAWYVASLESGAVVDRRTWREPPEPAPMHAMRTWLESELVLPEAARELVSRFAAAYPGLFADRE
jgi:hypothetical protein